MSVAFSPDGSTLASGSLDSIARLWDVSTGTVLHTLTDHTDWVNSVAFSPDGSTLASGSRDGTVLLWDVATGAVLHTLTGHTSSVHSVAFSPDGGTLASSSYDRTVRLWDVSTGTVRNTLTGYTGMVGAFSPDGLTLAEHYDQTVRLWDMATGTVLYTLTGHTSWIRSVAFSPDGGTLTSVGGLRNGTVRLWDVETGTMLYTLTGQTGWIMSVAFSPDGGTLASGSFNGTVRLWDVGTGTHISTLTGHPDLVESVAFSPDGSILASGSSDGTVLLWGLEPTAPPQLAEDVNGDGVVNILDLTLVAANFGATGQNAADVNGDGVVNILDLTLVAAAFGNTASAPELWGRAPAVAPTRTQVEQWLHQARQVNLTTSTFQRGIAVLEQLLARLTPKETALLANYPNPFNPETWIPYQLAESADVTVKIYATTGTLVRTLTLGHQPAGIYQTRHRAAYWDGRNTQGEPVASGVYFYTLTAGDFTATRKMLIQK